MPDRLLAPAVALVLLYRRIRYGYTFRRIKLTKGKYAIVDVEDYEWLNNFKWHSRVNAWTCYASRSEKDPATGRYVTVRMHRLILGAPENLFVDHINGNGLDNRKANLRIATCAQNNWNRANAKGRGRSGYVGVYWAENAGRWRAQISVQHKKIHLGYFDSKEAAARAYDTAATKYRKEFARTNFPQ